MADEDELERWWSKDTVAVVTGSNTGIGLATARQFAKHGLTVILTARDHAKGTSAMEVLKGEGLESLYFHPLDVTSSESVSDLAAWLKVNNAGVNMFSSTYDDGVTMLETNYYGAKTVTSGLQHLLQDGARIVNVSTTGLLQHFQSAELKETLADVEHLTEELVDSLADSQGFTNTDLRRGRLKWVQDQGVDVSKGKPPRG